MTDSNRSQSFRNSRRQLLRLLGAGGAAAALGETVGAEQPDPNVEITEQETDGESVVLSRIATPTDGELLIQDRAEGRNTLFARIPLHANTQEDDYVVELTDPIEESQTVEAWLFDDSLENDPENIAYDSAFVRLEDDPDHIGVTYVEAATNKGFNYPYYLFYPPNVRSGEVPILVEPNNTGTATDDFDAHRDRAHELIQIGDSRDISEALGVPLLVPVFPRPRSDPVDWSHYTHALDRETLQIDERPLDRIDLQLLAMVEHAKETVLRNATATFSEQIMLNGFSASGNFVDRFTVLHADRVLSVTAGGLNGMALLPITEADGHELAFHVGIAGVEAITGKEVNLTALDEVNQFLFMGADDDNDTIPYDDAWTDDELRQTALDVYGDDMIHERFPRCQEAYQEADVDAQFRIYEDVGHSTRGITPDLVEYHRRSIEGESVDEFGETIVSNVSFTVDPSEPVVGTEVEFDGTASSAGTADIITNTWDFDDGETAVGGTVTHEFDSPGIYEVTLRITDENGTTNTRTKEIAVVDTDSNSPARKYTNDEGMVDANGVMDAFEDWRNGDLGSGELQEVFGAWQSRDPVV